MVRNIFFYILILALSLMYLMPAYGQGEERGVGHFEAIAVSGGVEVILEPGDEEKVRLRTWGISEDQVEVFIKKKTLKIQVLNLTKIGNRKVKAYVTYKQLYGLKANSGSKIYGRERLKGDRMVVRATSGGIVDIEVETNSLIAHAGEGGVIEISGDADTIDVSASTGGRYEGYDLEANRTHARASMGGEITVVANESLDAKANMGGSIHYRGQPKEKHTRRPLGGSIHKL